jgi:hypothetical protein
MMLARLLLMLAAFTNAVLCQSGSLRVDGIDGATATLSAADLAKMHRHTVQTIDHGKPAIFEGVYVSDLLAKLNVPQGENLRGPLMALYLLVEAADGYRVVFSLADADPALTDHQILLALRRDGALLSKDEGPFRIVVPNDKRPARWVRQVTSMHVQSATEPESTLARRVHP